MKKVASLVLCVALLLTLAACGIPEGMEEQAQKVHTYNDGRYVMTTDYTYENGLLVREDISYWYRYGETYTNTYTYSYDSDGHITGVEVTTTNPDNTAKAMRREYVYEDLYFFDDTGLTEAE